MWCGSPTQWSPTAGLSQAYCAVICPYFSHMSSVRPRNNISRYVSNSGPRRGPSLVHDSASKDKYSVVLVCTGNICRSLKVEGVLRHKVLRQPWVDRVEWVCSSTHTRIAYARIGAPSMEAKCGCSSVDRVLASEAYGHQGLQR